MIYINHTKLDKPKHFVIDQNYLQLQFKYRDLRICPEKLHISLAIKQLDQNKQPLEFPLQINHIVVNPSNVYTRSYIGFIKPLSIGHRFYFPIVETIYDEYLELTFTPLTIHIKETWEYTWDTSYTYIKYLDSLQDLQTILKPFITCITNNKMYIKNNTEYSVEFNKTFQWYCDLYKLLPGEEQTIQLKQPKVIVKYNQILMYPVPVTNVIGLTTSKTLELTLFNFNHDPITEIENEPMVEMLVVSDKQVSKHINVRVV